MRFSKVLELAIGFVRELLATSVSTRAPPANGGGAGAAVARRLRDMNNL
jgi:hypothetical protein